jgi:hypothetical protein
LDRAHYYHDWLSQYAKELGVELPSSLTAAELIRLRHPWRVLIRRFSLRRRVPKYVAFFERIFQHSRKMKNS